jgi:RNA polymerase sigma-70 factor (ECF subfamily)
VTDNDPRLIEECLNGRKEAFTVLVRKYQERLYNTLYRLVGNAEDARDLAQEAFIQAYRSLDRFHGKAAFYTWLYRIAVNAAISMKRRQRVMASFDGGSSPGGLIATEDTERSDPGGRLEQAERDREVWEALASLHPDYRAVLVLKDMDGQKYETIAEILDCPIGTVRSRLHRARLELRERLRHLIEE